MSSLETVSVMISECSPTQFSLTVYEATRAVWADESIRHLLALSRDICEWAAPQFSLTVYESTGAVWADESFLTCDSSFGGYF